MKRPHSHDLQPTMAEVLDWAAQRERLREALENDDDFERPCPEDDGEITAAEHLQHLLDTTPPAPCRKECP